MKKISMIANFKIMKKTPEGYLPLSRFDDDDCIFLSDICPGQFTLEVNGKIVPIDWDGFTLTWSNENTIKIVTDSEPNIEEFADDYAEANFDTEQFSAETLASTKYIQEFFVYLVYENREYDCGYVTENASNESDFRISLVNLAFEDGETGEVFIVEQDVIDKFNRGEEINV